MSAALPNERPTATSAFDSTSIMATANILLGLTAQGAEPLGGRMAWANTFSSLVQDLEQPRTDCLVTLPEVPIALSSAYQIQRDKPLNDHMESQLIYYCVMNYAEEHHAGTCPGRPSIMSTQGKASDWMQVETKKLREKMRSA